MYGQSRIEQVSFEILNKEKKHKFNHYLAIGQSGQVLFSDLQEIVQMQLGLKDVPLLFCYDHEQEIYAMLQGSPSATFHYSLLSSGRVIQLRVEEKISDELLANPILKPQDNRQKRSPERDIIDAFDLVWQWRYLYAKGTINKEGQWQKVNLDKAASIINTPRKTLQDYFLLFRLGVNLGFQFGTHRRSKIGVLRSYVKQNKKQDKQKLSKQVEWTILRKIKEDLSMPTNEEMEEQLFAVINFSSDQDNVKIEEQILQYEQ